MEQRQQHDFIFYRNGLPAIANLRTAYEPDISYGQCLFLPCNHGLEPRVPNELLTPAPEYRGMHQRLTPDPESQSMNKLLTPVPKVQVLNMNRPTLGLSLGLSDKP